MSADPPPAPRRPAGGELRLTVWRRIDNYHRGLADDSPMARELHRRRLAALASALASSPTCTVTDWGAADGPGAPLKVSLRLRPRGRSEQADPPQPPLDQLARILGADGVRDEQVAAALWLIRRLRPPQRDRRLLDHEIALPGGRALWCDPDGDHLLITVTLAGGGRRHVHWREPPAAGGGHGGRPALIRL